MPSEHDGLFKLAFSDPKHVAVELRAVLPPALLALLDLDSLRLEPGSFVDEELAQSHSDLLLSVELHGSLREARDGLVYVLFEHQSSVDALMPLRLLEYVLKVLRRAIDSRRNERRSLLPLPLVIPVVLHHSESGWTASTDFESLFPTELLKLPDVARFVPKFLFLIDDLSKLSDEAILARTSEASEHLIPLFLWALRDARSPERFLSTLLRFSRFLEELHDHPNGPRAFRAILGYLSELKAQLGIVELRRLIVESHASARTKDIAMSLADQLRREWRQEGLQEGLIEGAQRGSRRVFMQLFQLKFGTDAASEFESRVDVATEDDISLWTSRVLTATSPHDIFG